MRRSPLGAKRGANENPSLLMRSDPVGLYIKDYENEGNFRTESAASSEKDYFLIWVLQKKPRKNFGGCPSQTEYLRMRG